MNLAGLAYSIWGVFWSAWPVKKGGFNYGLVVFGVIVGGLGLGWWLREVRGRAGTLHWARGG